MKHKMNGIDQVFGSLWRLIGSRLRWVKGLVWIMLIPALMVASGCNSNASSADIQITPSEKQPTMKAQKTATMTLVEKTPLPMHISNMETPVSQKILISTKSIGEYYWSDYGMVLFYETLEDKEWHAFDMEQGESVPVKVEMLGRTLTPTPLSEPDLVKAFGIEPYWEDWPFATISVSPSKEKLLFTIVNFMYGTPTSRLTPTDGETWPPEFSSELYLITKGEESPEYLGEIDGGIQDIYWFPEEDLVVLFIGVPYPIGEAHIWVVDLESKTFDPVLPSDKGFVPVFYGILPDGERFLYGILNEPGRRMILRSAYDGTEAILDLPAYRYWWPVDEDRILAVAQYSGMDEQSLFLYDLNSHVSEQVIDETFYLNYSSPNAITIAQDFSEIAYKENPVLGESPGGLYVINLSTPIE